ncbi:CLUMA_CG010664, isoform A [Clunio marinus]|uniref:Odorant receptor n=1 Tax=Clunio marinus TaxID=568069 RepID=A0A1J1ICI5_9DIPT|nr:CLUMA_CG010664, isoform A [Clunio marinus]
MVNLRWLNPSEDKINFESFVKFSNICFKLVFFTYRPLDEASSFVKKIVYAARIILSIITLFGNGLIVTSLTLFSLLDASDILEASANVPFVFTELLIAVRIIVILFSKQKVWMICNELKSLELNRESKFKKFVKENLKEYLRFITTYVIVMVGVMAPIGFPMIQFLINGTISFQINHWTPYDSHTPGNFLPTSLFIFVFAINCMFYMMGTDSLLYSLMTVVAMEFNILKIDFTQLKSLTNDERNKKINELIATHNKLLELADDLQSIYGFFLLYNFLTSSLMMCFLAFQISTGGDIGFYASTIAMVGGQVLLLCFYGQKILDSSSDVASGVYECGWEEFKDKSLKKKLLLVMMRAQNSKKLTAMGYVDISLRTFTTVR